MTNVSEIFSNTSSSGEPNGGCSVHHDSFPAVVGKVFAYCVLIVFTLVGNFLVIWIIYKNPRMRTVTNYFIANMALSDLLMPLFAMPIMITNEIYEPFRWHIGGPVGLALCKLLPFLQDVSTAVSIQSLVIIAMERFHAVAFPLKTVTFISSKGGAALTIALTWAVGAVVQSPYLYIYRVSLSQGKFYCYQNWEPAFDNQQSPKTFFLILFSLFFAVPFVFIAILYSAIIAKIRCQRTVVMATIHTSQQAGREKREKNVLKMSITIVLVFALLNFPFFLYVFLWQYKFNSPVCGHENYFFTLRFLVHVVGAINPCVYFVFSENFRHALRSVWCCARCSRPVGAGRVYPSKVINSVTRNAHNLHARIEVQPSQQSRKLGIEMTKDVIPLGNQK